MAKRKRRARTAPPPAPGPRPPRAEISDDDEPPWRPRSRRWWADTRGVGGWAAIGGAAVGLAVWWPLAVAGGATWLAMAIGEVRRSAHGMEHVASAFAYARREGVLDDKLVGTLDGMPFEIRNGIDTIRVLLGTPLPAELVIGPPRRDALTGDATFDARYGAFASTPEAELARRLMLTAEIRAALPAVFAPYRAQLHDGWWDVVVNDEDTEGKDLERLVREGIALGLRMWQLADTDDPVAALLAHIAREPLPAVRLDHYAWLVESGVEVPRVLQQAARDADPEVRGWADAQRPPDALYR